MGSGRTALGVSGVRNLGMGGSYFSKGSGVTLQPQPCNRITKTQERGRNQRALGYIASKATTITRPDGLEATNFIRCFLISAIPARLWMVRSSTAS